MLVSTTQLMTRMLWSWSTCVNRNTVEERHAFLRSVSWPHDVADVLGAPRVALELLEAVLHRVAHAVAVSRVTDSGQEDRMHGDLVAGLEEAVQVRVPVLRNDRRVPPAATLAELERERVGRDGQRVEPRHRQLGELRRRAASTW